MLREGARCDVIAGNENAAQIHISGRVLDGDGAGVPDAVIEVGHAAGFARVGTDEQGRFSFTTVEPGGIPFDGTTLQAPHLSLAVFARGLLTHLCTRIYFEDEPSTTNDPVLRHVPPARRATLIARLEPARDLTRSYRFDIVLQGESETAFFDFKSEFR